MPFLKALKDQYLRLDARSLGLFRVAMGLVLIFDLFGRLRFAKDLYSNEGVLPNHNHLFNLRETVHVWSALHAFSSPTEAQVGLLIILGFYVGFTLGFHTRAFQVLALVGLWSVGSRDILLENAGNYLATALLAFTLFLPLGSRFSLDSLRASLAAREEKGSQGLNDRAAVDPRAIAAARAPGWSPSSLAALAVLVQIAILYVCLARQQSSDLWGDGSALYYAMSSERLASGFGAWARGAVPGGLLSAWTHLFHIAEYAIVVLVLVPMPVPAAARFARTGAAALMVFTGLTFALPFALGLFGWSLVAAAALVIAPASWDRFEGHPSAKRERTVIYDVDCGVCLWLSRVVKRLDLRHHLTFRGNDDLDGLPAEVTPELVAETLVVVDADGKVHTRALAVSSIVGALPLGWLVAWLIRVPGIRQLADLAYDAFAARRERVSVAMGLAACGIDSPHDDAPAPSLPLEAAPAVKLARGVSGTLREALVLVVFAAVVVQATHANEIGWSKLPEPVWLEAVTDWPRMLERWDVLAHVSTEDEAIVVDAQTRGGKSVDVLTGKEPILDPAQMRGLGLGQLWSDYLFRIRQKEWTEFQRAFRDYLNKGGPKWTGEGEDSIVGYDVYYLKQPIPPPGQPRPNALSAREKFMSQARGGKLGNQHPLPILPGGLPKR